MFLTAYLGSDEGLSRWQRAVCAHADWLHAGAHLERRRLMDRRNLALGWVGRATATASTRWTESGEYIVATTGSAVQLDESVSEGADGWVDVHQHLLSNAVRISARLHSGEIRIVVPPTTPEQFYYARDACGYAFSSDMRLLLRMTGIELDPCGVCGLFQYGAIPPTMTVSKTVKRIQNGYMLYLRSCTDEPVFTPLRQQRCLEEQDNGSDNPVARVQAVLDSILSRVPEAAVLYFSGGVDSSLLASRMVQLGRTDIRLVNYSFGSTDQEGVLATQIASRLGLEYHQVAHEPSKIAHVLERIGKDYSFPFGDASTVPTNILVHESLPLVRSSSAVIEGTGADGAFAAGNALPAWRRVCQVPAPLRREAAEAYRLLKLWKQDSRLERIGRIVRRSVQMALAHAAVAQNALEGIAYTTPVEIRQQLEAAIEANMEATSMGLAPEERLSLLDLMLVCAGRMAAKSFDPLRTQGVRVVYPFLEPPMVSLSSSLSWAQKVAAGVGKALLKELLARDLPADWIYRPKRGFTPPFRDVFMSTVMQEYLRGVVLSPENLLIDCICTRTVRQMIDRAGRGEPVSYGVYNFLWVLTFTSGWLCQLRTDMAARRTTHPPILCAAYEAVL